MKIIEGMKKVKDLSAKIADLHKKIATYCVDMDFENPTYDNQAEVVAGWQQSVHDMLKEILAIRIAIQQTNLITDVPIEMESGQKVLHSIAEWILRRRELSKIELQSWACLSDRGLRDGAINQSAGVAREIRVRRYFSPAEKDKMMREFTFESSRIDAALEVINATTDLVM